jgi:hypothetical protein
MEAEMAKKSGKVTMYRSAKTGKLVTADYARAHPSTTEKETRTRRAGASKQGKRK